ncbi:Hypothetical predicted protein [Cloeon dipterum]|uniref:Uncharacterized protein n=1 Tax=Cloeon dipterum TaxID=197152 RepID=A0A8S1DQN3_9INSE|nr:Hypothetical predicted protein [Cloeon dipterum]
MMKRWSPRASPLRLSQLSPLASEDDVGPRSGGCTVVLDQLPSDMLESLSSDGHVRMSLPTPPDSVRGDDSTSVVEQDTVSDLLRDMVDRLDTPVSHVRRKKKRKSKKSRHHHEHQERPRVSPIFVWVKQAEEGVIGEVWCEDYDIRNRLRLTKTPAGWRAIPRTNTLSEMQSALRRDSSDSAGFSEEELSEREEDKVKSQNVQVDPESDPEREDVPDEDDEEEGEFPAREDAPAQIETGPVVPEVDENENHPEEEAADLPEGEDTLMDDAEDESECEQVSPEKDCGVAGASERSIKDKDEFVENPREQAAVVEKSETPAQSVPEEKEKKVTVLNLKGYSVKMEVPEEEEVVINPEQVADLSAKKREPGPLPCRSPLIRLPPLPRKPLPSPVLQQPPCEYRTPSPAHQALPVALPGVPRPMLSPLPAHVHERPMKRTIENTEVPAKKQKQEPTLRELLREKKQESRLMELLITNHSPTPNKRVQPPPAPAAPLDALAQLRLVMSKLRVPDPLLIPSRDSRPSRQPRDRDPRLLALPPAPLSPDVIAVSLDRLQALLQRPDSELLAWAAHDWALPKPPAWPPADLTALHLAAMGFCVPPPMDTWHTPPPPIKQMQFTPAAAAPMKNPPAQGPPKPRIACKALSDLMPKKNKQAPKQSGPLVSPPPSLTMGLQGATRNLPQLWHPLFGSHTSDSWNWRKTVPVHGD